MLESSPPLRKLETGTSATRWAATDSSMTSRRAGPADRPQASAATSSTFQYRVHRGAAVGRNSAHDARRQLLDALDRAPCRRAPSSRGWRRPGLPGRPCSALTECADDALQLGREDDAVLAGQVVQGLDAQRVSGENRDCRALVEDGEREHPPEPGQGRGTPVPPRLEDHLGVGAGRKSDARGRQLAPQLPVVVELAVVAEVSPSREKGWWPCWLRSMIERRRWASWTATWPCWNEKRPSSSGPRWAMRDVHDPDELSPSTCW